VTLKPQKNNKAERRRASRVADQQTTAGPDPLYPRISNEDAQLISQQRKIDTELWSKGEAYPARLARKLRLSGSHRKAADNPVTKMIVAQKADLRRKIALSSKLVTDFEFFLDKMDWYPELLLQQLYWDSNMMHADPQSVISNEKARTWPIDKEVLREILRRIRVLAEQMERLSETDFSPARTAILEDEKGERMHPADERYLLKAFRKMPDILRSYAHELGRKLNLSELYWPQRTKDLESLVAHARKTSLYEHIRAKTGQYHAFRLHRLVSASREVQGLRPVGQRALVVWLNRLKKSHKESPESPSPISVPIGSHRSPQS
jgi:hypothetical protein